MAHTVSEKMAQWQQRIADWRTSGLGSTEFCRRNGFSRTLFYVRRKQFAPETLTLRRISLPQKIQTRPISHELVQVQLPPLPLPAGSGVSLSLNGVRLNLDNGFDEDPLRRALAILEERPC